MPASMITRGLAGMAKKSCCSWMRRELGIVQGLLAIQAPRSDVHDAHSYNLSTSPLKVARGVEHVPTPKGSVHPSAGIMGAKQTAALIPLCHPLPLTSASVQLTLDDASHSVLISARTKTVGPTGVEMEALTGVAAAALTVYDMCKVLPLQVLHAEMPKNVGLSLWTWP